MNDQSHVVVRILSQRRYLSVARAAVQAMAQKLGMGEDQVGYVILVVEEALSNVIKHGYQGRTDMPIWLKLTPIERDGCEGLRIEVEDESRGVDLEKIKGRPLDELRPGGLGVHIIQKMMDEARYTYRPDSQGICLCMYKYIRLDQPPPAPGGCHE